MKPDRNVYRISSKNIPEPESNTEPTSERWDAFNKEVSSIEIKKYIDGEIIIDIRYYDKA